MADRGVSAPGVASDWLRPRLGRTWRDGVVVGVGHRAAYIEMRVTDDVGGHGVSTREVLAIEGPEAAGLPNGVRVGDGSVLARLAVGDRVVSRGPRVQVGDGVEVVVARWERRRPVPGTATMAVVARRLDALDETGFGRARGPGDRLGAGARDLVAVGAGRSDGPSVTVVDDLLGWGPGSTPSGDDLLAGFLATMVVLAPSVGRRADLDRLRPVVACIRDRVDDRTTPLSATLLRSALDGAMASPAVDLVRALTSGEGRGGIARTRAAATALERVGHTSGRDLAVGILAAVTHLARVTRSAAWDPGASPSPAPHLALQSLGSS